MSDFVEALNRAADVWWPYVLHGTWQSSLVAVALLGVVYLGRRLPAQVRYGLILIALAKFAVPATLSMPTGLFSRFGPTVRVSAPEAPPAESAGLDDPTGAAGKAAVASPGGSVHESVTRMGAESSQVTAKLSEVFAASSRPSMIFLLPVLAA